VSVFDPAEIAALRAETPGVAAGLMHFNSAGASLMSHATLNAMQSYLCLENTLGPMEAARASTAQIAAMRQSAAQLMGAQASEIAFMASGSIAWGMAFAALAPLRAGERVFVTRQEWGGNLATLQVAADRAGATIELIPCCDNGQLDLAALSAILDARVRLICLTYLPANGGLLHDAAALGKLANAAGIPYFIDASQALGQLPVDVKALGCDVLKAAGRKYLRGPRGTALLYVRTGFQAQLTPVFVDVASAPITMTSQTNEISWRAGAAKFESAEQSLLLLHGLGSALAQAQSLGVERIFARIQQLACLARVQLAQCPGVQMLDLGLESMRSGLVSFNVAGMDAFALQKTLQAQRINIGAVAASYTPIDMQLRALPSVARLALHCFNTEAEIAHLCAALITITRT
jgi:cysteine desulfurase / selenocysteine lyase